MSVMTSQILKLNFTKTQKSRYLEKETLLFLQIKKFNNYTSRATLWQKNSFVAEVTFKYVIVFKIHYSIPEANLGLPFAPTVVFFFKLVNG